MTHTPGPWSHGRSDGFWVNTICSPIDVGIAQVYGLPVNVRVDGFKPRGDEDETSLANARLIAAAPDLLAALHDLCDAIPGDTIEEDPPLGAWVDAARAAIAKAEGGAR